MKILIFWINMLEKCAKAKVEILGTQHILKTPVAQNTFLCTTDLVTQPDNFFLEKERKWKNKKSINSLIYFPIAKVKTLN